MSVLDPWDTVGGPPRSEADTAQARSSDIDDGWHRLHPITLLLATLRSIPNMAQSLIPIIAGIGISGNWTWLVPAFGALLIFSLGTVALWWWRFRWKLTDDAVVIESGILSRNHATLLLERIQDVAIERKVLARVFGVARVGFDTGAGGAKTKDAATLDSIALADAEALREAVRLHRARAVPSAARPVSDASTPFGEPTTAAAETEPDRVLYAMSPLRVVIAGIFAFSLSGLAILFGALQLFDDLLPFKPLDPGVWVRLAQRWGLDNWIDTHRWFAVIGALVTLITLSLLLSIGRTVIREGGFTLTRTPTGMRRTRGLTTRTDVVMPVRRICAAIVNSGPIRRRFGFFSLAVQSLGKDGASGDHVLAPLATADEVTAILTEIPLHDPPSDAAWHRIHPTAVVGPALFALALAVVAVAAYHFLSADDATDAMVVNALTLLLGVASGVTLVGTYRAWRRTRWTFDGHTLFTEGGWWSQSRAIVPAASVQSANVRIGPLNRLFGTAALAVDIPGGSGFSPHGMAGLDPATAQALRRAILDRSLQRI